MKIEFQPGSTVEQAFELLKRYDYYHEGEFNDALINSNMTLERMHDIVNNHPEYEKMKQFITTVFYKKINRINDGDFSITISEGSAKIKIKDNRQFFIDVLDSSNKCVLQLEPMTLKELKSWLILTLR